MLVWKQICHKRNCRIYFILDYRDNSYWERGKSCAKRKQRAKVCWEIEKGKYNNISNWRTISL